MAITLAASVASDISGSTFFHGRQSNSGTTGFGQSDGNGLLAGARPVFSLVDVMKLFAHKFPGLSGG
jgi:hypothetical protein